MSADLNQLTLTILLIFVRVNGYKILADLLEVNQTDFNHRSHLKYNVVIKSCENRDAICKSNNRAVCAMRKVENETRYKDFENICYLFLSNMCDNPGSEYYAVQGGSCEVYLASRRNEDATEDSTDYPDSNVSNSTEESTNIYASNSTQKDVLRTKTMSTLSTLYDIFYAFDSHLCPKSCPRAYSPVCVNINRVTGKYFKLLYFVNHCEADVYYCKNWEEFSPPPGEDEERVDISPLSWSYCGDARYLQFARFSEVASSMGHYGWLAGDFKYSHIMEPHQRIPGYGR